MSIPAFDPRELEVVSETPETPMMPSIKIFNYPVTNREGVQALVDRKPIWQIIGIERQIFTPRILPDNVSRAFVFEAEPFDQIAEGGGPDIFGIEWEYIPVAGGSMVRPGEPYLKDANEWVDKVVWPDIDSWDWEGSAKANNGTFLKPENFNIAWFQTGFYERLVSLMDFEGAIMAMVDDDQTDAVSAFFDKLADLYIQIFDRYLTHYDHIHGFYFHDDWGSQRETFFSPKTAKNMIVPAMRKVTEFIHSKGLFAELHSCGQLMKQVPNMIEAGWDAWGGQAMNETQEIYEKYGDQILIGVIPDEFDPKTTTEEDQRAAAKIYADKFCRPEKPSFLNNYGWKLLTPEFREELYKQSRINYNR